MRGWSDSRACNQTTPNHTSHCYMLDLLRIRLPRNSRKEVSANIPINCPPFHQAKVVPRDIAHMVTAGVYIHGGEAMHHEY